MLARCRTPSASASSSPAPAPASARAWPAGSPRMGRDLALVARRADRLEALKKELLAAHPGIRVEAAALDIDDVDAVAASSPSSPAGWAASTGSSPTPGWARAPRSAPAGPAQPPVLHTNVIGTHAAARRPSSCSARRRPATSSSSPRWPGIRGMGGTRTAYATSKAAPTRSPRASARTAAGTRDRGHHGPPWLHRHRHQHRPAGAVHRRPGHGVDALVAAIEREPVRAYVPEWPWRAWPR